ncbi:MAG: pyridoxal-phosphate dependent enzyme, partial [Bacteroidales bacterium]
PQSFYYVAGYLAAVDAVGDPTIFAVPTGNIGNLTAGVIARRLGVPISRLIAATNANRVLPDFLDTGTYRARPSIATLSNAMDVGDPSNFSRLLELHDASVVELRRALWSASIDESTTRATIRAVHARTGYVLDPHTAVAWAAGDAYLAATDSSQGGGVERTPVITLATAHPAKFGDVIREELAAAPRLPDEHVGWQSREPHAIDLPGAEYEAFRRLLLERLP